MKKTAVFLAVSLIPSGLAAAFDSPQNDHMITAMLYMTPPAIVTTTFGGPAQDEKGVIVGRTIGGTITSQFPEAVVLLKLGGPAQFQHKEIRSIIEKNFVFKCGDILSKGLPSVYLGKKIFSFRDGIVTKCDSDPMTDEFDLQIDLISIREESWILAVQCGVAGPSEASDTKQPSLLLDHALSIKTSEPVLIGLPHLDSQRGRIIYWLALFLDETEESIKNQ